MRLQVYLSHSGACSRRKALALILAGRVMVNGNKIVEPSFAVSAQDHVVLDRKQLSLKSKITILLHKPKGVVTTKKDAFAAKKVVDLLPSELRFLNPVGRLDQDTTGLLLLTSDGDLAFRLTHPSFEVAKTYRVALDKPLAPQDKTRIEKGVILDAQLTSASKIIRFTPQDLDIVIHEGRKRQVRRMFAAFGYHVVSLCRIQQGSLALGALKEGAWRFLTQQEVQKLEQESKM
jgi:pseudouridine synthase